MKSIPQAFSWEIYARGRKLLMASAILLISFVLLGLTLNSKWVIVGQLLSVIMVTTYFVCLVSIYVIGSYDSRRAWSGYAKNLFTFPVSTSALVNYPMIHAVAGVTLGWLAMWLALRLWGFDLPILVTVLAAVALVTWLLAMSWWPFGSDMQRALTTAFSMFGMFMIVIWLALVWNWGYAVYYVALPIICSFAYFLAWKGVSIDRQGGGRKPLGLRALFEWVCYQILPPARQWTTSRQAQSWYEWSSKSIALPVLVGAICLLVTGLFVWLPSTTYNGGPGQVTLVFVIALATLFPPFLAVLMGGLLGKDDSSSKSDRMGPFLGVKPVATLFFVRHRFRSATLFMLLAWAAALAFLPVWLYQINGFGPILEFRKNLGNLRGDPNSWLTFALVLPVAFVYFWKALLAGMTTTFCGRTWVSTLFGGAVLSSWLFLGWGGAWLWERPEATQQALDAAPWVLGLLVAIKWSGSAWAYREGMNRRLYGLSWVIFGTVAYTLMTGVILAFIVAAIPPQHRHWPIVLPALLLSAPLGRIGIAPVALEWNRRR